MPTGTMLSRVIRQPDMRPVVTRNGTYWVGRCPVCGKPRGAWVGNKFWLCAVCQIGGPLADFVLRRGLDLAY